MDTKAKLAAAKSDSDIDFYTNKCDRLETQINNTVYTLYNLTPEEIRLVESS